MAYKWGLLATYKSWDDPPSTIFVWYTSTLTSQVDDSKFSKALDALQDLVRNWQLFVFGQMHQIDCFKEDLYLANG